MLEATLQESRKKTITLVLAEEWNRHYIGSLTKKIQVGHTVPGRIWLGEISK